MAFLLRVSRVALAATALSVPFAASGACGSRTACFAYTQGEYDLHGSCPAQADALASFSGTSCPGAITSVDGPGSFDGLICCYPVTYGDVHPICNGAGGGMTTGPGMPPGEVIAVSSGPGCLPSCGIALMTSGPPCSFTSAGDTYANLQACAGCIPPFDDAGPTCTGECGAFCQNGPVDQVCETCLATNCAPLLQNCQQN